MRKRKKIKAFGISKLYRVNKYGYLVKKKKKKNCVVHHIRYTKEPSRKNKKAHSKWFSHQLGF